MKAAYLATACLFFVLFCGNCYSQRKENFYGPAMIQNFGEYAQGQTVKAEDIIYRLFLERKCGLPMAGAGNMRSALIGPWNGMKQEGCWYKTMDGGYVIVYRDGTAEKQSIYSTLLRVDLLDDGSGIVKQRRFNFQEEVAKDSNRRIKDFQESVRSGIK